MHRRSLRRWARLATWIVGLTSLACCSASAQRNSLADLSPVPPPLPFDLSTGRQPAVSFSGIPAAAEDDLPDAPVPNIATTATDAPAVGGYISGTGNTPQEGQKPTAPGFPPITSPEPRLPPSPAEHPSIPSLPAPCQTGISTSGPANISCAKNADYFQRFVDSGIHPLTPRQKGILAIRNTTDIYNFSTIALISAISVASDPDSPYGPGIAGFGRNFGVAYCETAVGEFFGTFLIPSIVHQDPHYHRMPNASYTRRTIHAITQVVWAQSDYGVGMPNYANLGTTAIGGALGNLYVPGRDKSWGAGAARYATAIATDPIDNFITEFLPDVARHVNVNIILLHQIVNQVELQH